jgi:hypothetical protein
MQPSLDVRRHPDGSPDFDFYRRRAARSRRLVRQHAFRRAFVAAGPAVKVLCLLTLVAVATVALQAFAQSGGYHGAASHVTDVDPAGDPRKR